MKMNNNLKNSSGFKVLWCILIVGVMIMLSSISLVSAFDFDNVKSYNAVDEEITIKNAFGLPFIGDDLAKYKLTYNTNQCLINCYAEGTATLYTSGYLFTDLNFKDINGRNTAINSNSIYLWENLSNPIIIIDYEKEICNMIINVSGNKEVCTKEYLGTHIEDKGIMGWKSYEGEVLSSGTYNWRIEGQKNPKESVDWIGTSFGEDFTEWAWWSTDYQYKVPINFKTNVGNTVRVPFVINGSAGLNGEYIWVLPQENFSTSTNYTEYLYYNDITNLSSVHVVNTSENQELPMAGNNWSLAGYQKSSVWEDSGVVGVWHFEGDYADGNKGLYNWSTEGTAFGFVSSKYDRGLNAGGDGSNLIMPAYYSALDTADFTACVWANWDALDARPDPSNDWIFLNTQLSSSSGFWAIIREHSTGKIGFSEQTNGNLIGTTVVNVDNWYHICVTKAGVTKNATIYVNGTPEISIIQADARTVGNTESRLHISGRQEASYYPTDANIDEVRYWNRTLTTDEIKMMYDDGNEGMALIEEETQSFGFNSIFPTDSYTSTSNIVGFNGTARTAEGVLNISLYIDGILNDTFYNTTTSQVALDFNKTVDLQDGTYNWVFSAWNTEGNTVNSSSRTLYVDTSYPTITIHSPPTNVGLKSIPYNLTLNFTATDTQLDSCYYNTSYNITVTPLTCNTLTQLNISTSGSHTVYVFANDTNGRLTIDSLTFTPLIVLNSQTYNTETFEDSTEYFWVNFTYNNTKYLSIITQLIYNGTIYTGIRGGSGSIAIYNVSVIAPTVNELNNVNFFWNITLSNGTANFNAFSNNYQQSVKPLSVINVTTLACSAGFFESINYTFADAGNRTNISSDISYNFKYGTGNLTAKTIYGNFLDTSILRICINATVNSYKLGYGELDYDVGTSYVERRFYMYTNKTLSNETGSSYTLYDLLSASSTSFIFEIKNTFLNPYTNKYVALLRWYPDLNEYLVTEMALTDSDGKTVMKVKTEDVDYRIGVYELDGTLIKLTDPVRMACLIDPCTYTLKITTDDSDYFSVNDVTSSIVWDEDNDRFIFTWSDSSQATSEMRFEVYKDAGFQQVLICNDSSTGYTGVMTCGVGNLTGSFYAKAYRSASPSIFFAVLYHLIRDTVSSSFGLLVGFILALAAGLIGLFSPIAAIALLIVGLIPALAFGAVTIEIFVAIGVLGGIVIHYMLKGAGS